MVVSGLLVRDGFAVKVEPFRQRLFAFLRGEFVMNNICVKRIKRTRPGSTPALNMKRKRKTSEPRRPEISLSEPGRLRSAHVLALCGFRRSTLYNRMSDGTFPKPDGDDGRNYWNTKTIRTYLDAGN